MSNRSGNRKLFSAGRVFTRAELRRLKGSWVNVAEPVAPKPRGFSDVASDQTDTRVSFARPIMHALEALEVADTPQKQQSVLNNFARYCHEGMAILKARLRSALHLTTREAVSNAQRDDMDEDCAESAYLTEKTPSNRQRWIDALVKQQQSAAILEMHLRAESDEQHPAPHTLRIAR